jgi:adenosylcobinamide-phosphate synthase
VNPEAWIVLVALAVEAAVGYPAWLHARVPHPVVWAGNAINSLERRWNQAQYSFARRRVLGCVAMVLVVGAAFVVGRLVELLVSFVIYVLWGGAAWYAAVGASIGHALYASIIMGADIATHTLGFAENVATVDNPYGLGAPPASAGWSNIGGAIFIGLVGTVGLAQRSLFQHVRNVLISLRGGDLTGARERVGLIVGRDTRQLDTAGVSAAALESLAESFNDGIVAPAFWFFLGGLPGLFAYKALNTADSLIGHKEERWRAFGWGAARADDVANLVPARIAGTLLVFAGWAGLWVMVRDAHKHASPNAGWPEAAMAGALGVRLGGPATYDGVLHERPVFGTGPAPGVGELGRGLRIYLVACALLWLALGVIGTTQAVFRWGPTWPL